VRYATLELYTNIQDIPEGCSKNITWKLLKYMWHFDKEKQEMIQKLQEKYPQVNFRIFHNTQDADAYLSQECTSI
jgi:hypothetical protein